MPQSCATLSASPRLEDRLTSQSATLVPLHRGCSGAGQVRSGSDRRRRVAVLNLRRICARVSAGDVYALLRIVGILVDR